jgi:phosphatidylserine decarboxylase
MRNALMLLIGFLPFMVTSAQSDCPAVTKLKSMYSDDVKLRSLMDSVFSHVQDLPDGSLNYWRHKNMTDLYGFLNQWCYKLPTVANGMGDIVTFSMLYYHNPYGLKFVEEEPGLSWSLYFVREQGKFMDSRQSTGSIPQWLADSTLHNADYLLPDGGYTSFNQFFTRELKPGMRPVARPNDNSVVVAPVDGIATWLDLDLKADSALPIKGRMKLHLNQLLPHSQHSGDFVDGSALAFILLPRNYHHFHAPVSGRLVESREDAGQVLFGSQLMDWLMTGTTDASVFENYKHGYFIFETERYGYVAMIPVGLETVGSVVFEKIVKDISSDNEVNVGKGQKLGHFAYGGSMVILLFQKGRLNSMTVQQGQQIGIFSN